MAIRENLKANIAGWPYWLTSVLAALAAFGAYSCMYAFRKAFAAGTYTDQSFMKVDYKVWLVIAQVIGYTLSKFYGIRFIAELKGKSRGLTILLLVGSAWMALLGFALVPAPYNIFFLFLNGFPLGLIWGLIFGYLEGRRSTEFMASVLSISLIFGSGFVKTVGQTLIHSYQVSEYFMPFIAGALFVLPLAGFVFLLDLMPLPTAQDKLMRTERKPMNAKERKQFILRFLPGIILTLLIYVLLTVMRDIRDNFEVEIWDSIGIKDKNIYAKIDGRISIVVLFAMSLLFLIKKNLKAFSVIHLLIIGGCILIGTSTLLFTAHVINPVTWMTMAGLGLYLGYIPYNAIFFERMIATFHVKSNVGFVMYLADSIGYLASVSVLLVKEFGRPNISWGTFFIEGIGVVAVVGTICSILSLIYFYQSARRNNSTHHNLKFSTI
ncbi:DUF5690 family protein [Pedobacter rhodius]|uniref:DUF5690 family protein n=1 Tax=Pedobacter rhodius TaxID=3004098 RepID=A0ABT4KUG9_9SPHI|nr:DUF5690 family protein [Pedobacter sp. SJ11]MCZ4222558.1 DUF5690 family protein [Pedobacter sp. SJ11]